MTTEDTVETEAMEEMTEVTAETETTEGAETIAETGTGIGVMTGAGVAGDRRMFSNTLISTCITQTRTNISIITQNPFSRARHEKLSWMTKPNIDVAGSVSVSSIGGGWCSLLCIATVTCGVRPGTGSE